MCETIIPIRLMLLDDHEFVLRGMQHVLDAYAEFEVLGCFTRSRDLLLALKQSPVDVVVMDFALGPEETDGLNLIRALRIKFPAVRLLVISATHTPATVSLALRCGAMGFIGKDSDPFHLLEGLRTLANGAIYLEPPMSRLLEDRGIATQVVPDSGTKGSRSAIDALVRTNNLTLREREVLRCCLAGMSVTQVAEKFSRSIKTISTQKQSAYRKLGLASDNELFKIRSQLERR
jgi:DNA-binding NarL/FixJ family response regulator